KSGAIALGLRPGCQAPGGPYSGTGTRRRRGGQREALIITVGPGLGPIGRRPPPDSEGETRMVATSEWTKKKKSVTVHGYEMAYVDLGSGDPIVFLHGNPTSSFLWRNIAPHVADLGRCIVPDLIGMGDSAKLRESGPDSYRFVDHRQFLDGFLEELQITEKIVFVVHDWGSALGFDWARRHPTAVRGLTYMESIVCPMGMDEWPARRIFEGLRSPDGGAMVL